MISIRGAIGQALPFDKSHRLAFELVGFKDPKSPLLHESRLADARFTDDGNDAQATFAGGGGRMPKFVSQTAEGSEFAVSA